MLLNHIANQHSQFNLFNPFNTPCHIAIASSNPHQSPRPTHAFWCPPTQPRNHLATRPVNHVRVAPFG